MLADGPSTTETTALLYNDEIDGVVVTKKLNSHIYALRNVSTSMR